MRDADRREQDKTIPPSVLYGGKDNHHCVHGGTRCLAHFSFVLGIGVCWLRTITKGPSRARKMNEGTLSGHTH